MAYKKLHITGNYSKWTTTTRSHNTKTIKRLCKQCCYAGTDYAIMIGDDGYSYQLNGKDLVQTDYIG